MKLSAEFHLRWNKAINSKRNFVRRDEKERTVREEEGKSVQTEV